MANILVIDDEKLARFTVRKILEQAGHKIIETESGTEGVRIFQAQPCDLVITDIIMPGKEGIETINDIKRISPRTPIIAMSGGGRTGNLDFLKLAQQRGADQTISKPFKPDELLGMVSGLLKSSPRGE
ncbi:MAG: Response regulator, CheY-like receiver [Rhodospirillales bacterium]|jgi:CheY-like chemotaxis protein|nr:Response regulator, CheY-like receiver [Rhodospirillales bacterium]